MSAEHMGFGESLLLSLIGIGIVFAVLVVLSLFIWALSAITRAVDLKPAPLAETSAPTLAPAAESNVPAAIPASAGDIKLHNVDDATAAMVMAIVADELEQPLNELVFRSIREITDEEMLQKTKGHEGIQKQS